MEKTVDQKKRINFQSYSPVVIFLVLEVFAFVTFSFGDSYLLYGILGLVILALLALVTYKEIKLDGIVRSAFFVFPLFVYGLITVLSNYYQTNTLIDTTTKAFIPISLTVFAASGCLLAGNKSFKISTALLVIYSTLALVTLINFIYTMAQFTPFYTIGYKDYFMYYGGQRSESTASNIAYALVGYQFKEVTIGFFSLFPSLLLTSAIMLFFVSPKKETRTFILYSCFTLIAFLSLLFIPTILSLITDVIVLIVIAVLVLFSKKILPSKPIKIGVIVILSLVFIGIVLVFLNAQEWSWLSGYQNFIASNSFLNKLFNGNYIAVNVKDILYDMFSSEKIFGFFYSRPLYDIVAVPSNMWIFDNLMTSGFFGGIFFLIAIVYGILGLNKYMKYSDDNIKDKTSLYALILSYFLYTLISGDVYYQVFNLKFNFIFVTGPFLVIVLLLGYASNKGRKCKAILEERRMTNEAEA